MANGNLVTMAGLRALLASMQDDFSEVRYVHHFTNLDGGVRFEVRVSRKYRDVSMQLYNVSERGCRVALACTPVQVELRVFNSDLYTPPNWAANYFVHTRGYARNVVEASAVHDPPLLSELELILDDVNTVQHLQLCPCGEAYVSPQDMCACCMMSCTAHQLEEETCVICHEGVPRMYSRRNSQCCGCHMHRRCYRGLARSGRADTCPHCRHCKLGSGHGSTSSLASLDSYDSVP